MRRFLFLVMLLLAAVVSQASVVITNNQGVELTYDLIDKDAYAIVMPSTSTPYAGVVEIPENVVYNGQTYAVKMIAEKAFFGCRALTTITIPKTITQIGGHAFKGCDNLSTVNYNATNCILAAGKTKKGVTPAFEDCKSITNINLGGDVVSIPEYIFWGCSGVSSLTIPEYVTSIGGRAFCDCSGLTTLRFEARSCESMGSNVGPAFQNTQISVVTFGQYVTKIPDRAFQGNTTLTQITIPEDIVSIGEAAFFGCSNLTTVNFNATDCNSAYKSHGNDVVTAFNNPSIKTINFGQKVHNVPSYIFAGCSGITDVQLSPSTERIGESAFLNCTSIQQVTIPETVTEIGGKAFGGCTSLTTVNFNAINCVNATTYSKNLPIPAFDCPSITTVNFGAKVGVIPDNAFANCRSLRNVTIPGEVKQIGVKAFYNCSSLMAVTIPEQVTSIGGLAFGGCDNLTTLNFNARRCTGVTKVENNLVLSAFQNCASIKTVTIGEDVELLPEYLLQGCSGVTKINIPKGVKQIGRRVFEGCQSLATIYYDAERCEIFSDAVTHRSIFSLESLTGLTLGPDVKEIPNYAFAGCTRLAAIVLPEGIEMIGKFAFEGCTSLKKITIPENVRNIGGGAFMGCASLNDIVFNAVNCLNMKTVEKGVTISSFINSPALRIVIGPKVESIPDFAFYGCTMTNSITWGKSLQKIGAMSFAHVNMMVDIVIPEHITSIGGGAFSDCENLTTVTFNAVSCVAAFSLATDSTIYPFGGKNKINDITIGKKVKQIPEGLFYGLDKITVVEIPAGVTSIGALAFANCTLLKSVLFNATKCEIASGTVKEVVRGPFENCPALVSVNFDDKVLVIPAYLFKDCASLQRAAIGEKSKCTIIGAHAFENCSALKNIRISEYIDVIGDYALYNTGINKFAVHSFMKEIGVGAIGACKLLANVTCKKDNESFVMKDGILYTKDFDRVICCPAAKGPAHLNLSEMPISIIDDGAFMYCAGIVKVTLPSTVSYIGKDAFYNCVKLKEFFMPTAGMPTCPGPIFDPKIKANVDLKVGPGTVMAYRNHEIWKGFKNVGETFAPTYEIKYEYDNEEGKGKKKK